jgi:glycosyltransferase involved in cell wall biosynthesis
MKILIVSSEAPPIRSGVARSVDEIANGLRARGHSVTLLSGNQALNLRWDRIRLSLVALKVWRTIKSEGPFDVVNVHGPSPTVSDLSLLISVISRKVKSVVYTHHFNLEFGVPVVDFATSIYSKLTWPLIKRFCSVVVTSSDYAELHGSGTSKISVIPWGVDQPSERIVKSEPLVSEPLKVIAVGQLRRYKGMAVAIDAVLEAENAVLTIVGDGPLHSHFAECVAQHPEKITLVRGASTVELEDLYRKHDVILLSSRTQLEAFGLVLLEGMSFGCIPIASNLPGVRSIPKGVGFKCEPNNPTSFAEALNYLNNNRQEMKSRMDRSISKSEEYLWDYTVERYEAVFLENCNRTEMVA